MKQFILLFALLSAFAISISGQTDDKRFSYTTTIGTGIAMSQPSCTPFTWQIMSHYHINQRFAIGAGTGLSVYEKALIPLYASAQYFITKPKTLNTYIECNIGGSFATTHTANGGFYPSPSIGLQFNIAYKLKMNCALGYELQELEQLRKHTDQYFHTEFKEELSHHSITFKVGLTY